MNGKQLRNSILQWAISGRLVPQDPNDEPAIELLKRINPKAAPLSPDDAPFTIPDSWCWCKVGDIVQINPKNDCPDGTMAAFIPMEKIEATYGSKYTYDEVKWCSIKKGYTHFADGDVAFAKITPCFQNRKSAVFKDLPNGIGAGTTELKVLRPYGETLNRWYLLYFLKSSYFIAEAKFKGTANQQRVVKGYLENKMFPLPPLAEQERIVRKVEELLPLVERYDKAQTDLDRLNASLKGKLRASVLQEAISGRLVPQDPTDEPAIELLKRINPKFTPQPTEELLPAGWTACTLEDIVEIKDNLRQPINSAERNKRIAGKKESELYPYYGATGQVGYIDKYLMDGKYLLLGEDGAPFLDKMANKAYIVEGKCWVNNHAHVLLPHCNTEYMCLYLNQFSYYSYVTGSTRLKLTQASMKKMPVLVPPLAEQERIVGKVEELFAVLDALQ